MAMSCLIVLVHLHAGRYHGQDSEGRPEWPPSPARLFQALVAGAAQGANIPEEDRQALVWLEGLADPVIAAPIMHKGQAFRHFMPNNDLDTVGGNPARIGEIRSATKRFHPRIFDGENPLFYVWSFAHGREHAERMCKIAEQLYQLGRGVDMAWATAEVVDDGAVEDRLAVYPGVVYQPSANGDGLPLACPCEGALNSLTVRYEKARSRFHTEVVSAEKKTTLQTFSQPPKPRFKQVCYACPPSRLLFELRDPTPNAGFFPWPFSKIAQLMEIIRNNAAETLCNAFPEQAATIKRVFGLCRDATEADKSQRIRLIPLPSIGHHHVDHGIRRVLIEVPPDCSLAAGDIAWAFAGVEGVDLDTGEIQWMLVAAEDNGMLDHYGIGANEYGFRTWRTVTPIALPIMRSHGRMKGTERADTELMAATAVAQALRHAGITTKPVSIRVQREPFEAKCIAADRFAQGTRFASARLWHVEITLDKPISGPLVVGDGRYVGLGLLHPLKRTEGIHAFKVVSGLTNHADPQLVARALRRAVMHLVQQQLKRDQILPLFFTGHEENGTPARRGGRSHLAFVFDAPRQRLLVIAPHLLEGRQPSYAEYKNLAQLDGALANLRELRAGAAGRMKLEPLNIIIDHDPLFALSSIWSTQTEYRPTRYGKKITSEQAIITDVGLELRRRGLPAPASVECISVATGPKSGLSAKLRLVFSTAVNGPLLLGKTCNLGGGLFAAEQ
jgi:CRISPR-associated protein Csb2